MFFTNNSKQSFSQQKLRSDCCKTAGDQNSTEEKSSKTKTATWIIFEQRNKLNPFLPFEKA